jgi:hypothetical protein
MLSAPWTPTSPAVLEALSTTGGEIALRTWAIVIFGVIMLILAGIGSYKLVKVSKKCLFCFSKIGCRVKKSLYSKSFV